ncbi:MAG: hypothetical protein JEZ11_02735 [Desulfobacterales bacterium]|nr:hypothetical protein [Desulfobacterales bacterium]
MPVAEEENKGEILIGRFDSLAFLKIVAILTVHQHFQGGSTNDWQPERTSDI